jgi:hypothetical protein
MLKIGSIVYPENESKVLIFCRLDNREDLEILAFILSNICSGTFCIEYHPDEVLEILEEITKDIELEKSRGNLIFGLERRKEGLAFLFGR